MTKRLEPRGIRPSEDIIRRRLVERRLAHELAQKNAGWFDRPSRSAVAKVGRRAFGGGFGQRPSLTSRLRDRPVAAFLAATVAGIAMIGAVGSILRLDLTLGEGGGSSAQLASTAPSAQATRTAALTGKVSPVDKGSDAINVGSTTRTAPRIVEAGQPSLRDTTGVLPPTVRTGPVAAAKGPSITNAAVAAALALRLPREAQAGSEATSQPALQSDRMMTTGSITQAVTRAPVEPEQLAGELERQADGLGGEAGASASGELAAVAPPDENHAETTVAEPAATAIVTANVNLRAGPDNDATILGVLGKGQSVTIETCDLWCKVGAGGKSGYVFKSFVDKAG